MILCSFLNIDVNGKQSKVKLGRQHLYLIIANVSNLHWFKNVANTPGANSHQTTHHSQSFMSSVTAVIYLHYVVKAGKHK